MQKKLEVYANLSTCTTYAVPLAVRRVVYCGILRHVAVKMTQHAARHRIWRRIRCERSLTHSYILDHQDLPECTIC